MALGVYTKSMLWLFGFSGLGYILMILTEPSESKKELMRETYLSPLSADDKKKLLFMQKLKEASTDTPIYLQKPKKD